MTSTTKIYTLFPHLALSERTVRYMISDGRLKGYRLGRTVRIDLNEVDDALLPFGVNR
jgi:excisionase family DNA binding protein